MGEVKQAVIPNYMKFVLGGCAGQLFSLDARVGQMSSPHRLFQVAHRSRLTATFTCGYTFLVDLNFSFLLDLSNHIFVPTTC
ncbi:hypothetical protein PHET_11193 [Paragonimus heterotremus]|uniref:Uncharacterized protein n=1 Tax=Paragonimus heterotremus TaxID=100268 RepID=A0A8J4WDT9_9TREM|nr:hypothetical protein PHET_11193 [Paragonimus heterotremus]